MTISKHRLFIVIPVGFVKAHFYLQPPKTFRFNLQYEISGRGQDSGKP